jgi:nucleolar pre-ribosomal-associated protein 2
MDFTDLDRLGELMARAGFANHTNNKVVGKDFVDLLEELATRTLKQMTANVEKREQGYLRKAVKAATAWPVSPADSRMCFRIVLVKRLLLAVKQPSVLKVLRDVDTKSLENRLCEMMKAAVQHLTNGPDPESLSLGLPGLSTVLEAVDALPQDSRSRLLVENQEHLENTLTRLAASDETETWTLRKFLLQASAANGKPVADMDELLGFRLQSNQDDLFPHKETMLQCVDIVIERADEDTRLQHIDTLLREQGEGSARLARLLAVQRILQQLEGSSLHPRHHYAKPIH